MHVDRCRMLEPLTGHGADEPNARTSGGAAEAARGYGIARQVLPNGIVVLAREIPDPDIVVVSIGVRGGARFEDDQTAGAAKFMEKLFVQGTERRPSPDEVQRPITIRGGVISTLAGSELVILQGQVRGVDVDVLFDVLADVLLASTFAPDRVENERRVILEELNMRRANPNILASDLFFEAVFEGHPLARSAAGDPDNTPRVSRETLLGFRDQFFVGSNTVVGVAGNLTTAEAFQRVERALGSMTAGVAAPPSVVPPPARRRRRIDQQAGTSQARVIIGGPLPGLVSEDRFPLAVASAVLGASGFRLFREIRDKRGLSYDPAPGQMLFPDAGVWMAAAGTDPSNVDLVIELLKAEHARLGEETISDEELTNAKEYLIGSLVIGLETASAQSGQIIRDEAFGSPVLSPEYRAGIERVTADDVRRVAATHLHPEEATLVVVQP